MKNKFTLLLGPCVIESIDHCFYMAEKISTIINDLKKKYEIDFFFKASFDKANRSNIHSFRGPGIEEGLKILSKIKDKFNIKITTDVHEVWQIELLKKEVDLIQIPAFLSRQTDLITSATKTGKLINVKKAQFMSPIDVKNIIDKSNIDKLYITERGSAFGYNNLVVDMCSFVYLKEKFPKLKIIFDATHSAPSFYDINKRKFVKYLAQSAVASSNIDGIFMEVHNDPDNALCDGGSSVNINDLKSYLIKILDINNLVKKMI